jgi:hypothetical protein
VGKVSRLQDGRLIAQQRPLCDLTPHLEGDRALHSEVPIGANGEGQGASQERGSVGGMQETVQGVGQAVSTQFRNVRFLPK